VNVEVLDDVPGTIAAFCALVSDVQPRTFVLTGGGTAGGAYRLLASNGWRARLDWDEMTLFFGDERRVPPDSPDSNYRTAEETLLAGVRPARVERMRGEAEDAEAEADRYGALLPSSLDLTMLGMGADGHCASLFPGEPSVEVDDRLCVPSRAHYAPYERLTLTFPALARSRQVAFLVVGENKADAVGRIARGEDLPSARVRAREDVTWFLDRAAAARLP
jgi:6-phosphogluconolactonase